MDREIASLVYAPAPDAAPRRTEEPPFRPIVEEIGYREPMDILAALPLEPGLVFLDSAMPHPALGRWSWLAPDPFGRFVTLDGAAIWNGDPVEGRPLDALRDLLARFAAARALPAMPFQGGASGYFAYEAGRLFEHLPAPKSNGAPHPEIDLWFHDVGIAFDVVDRRAFLVSAGAPEEGAARRRRARERAAWLKGIIEAAIPRQPNARIVIPRSAWRANMTPAGYKASVERTRRYIIDGDIFQANITQALRADLPENFDPLTLYGQLRTANPAPFAALIVTPGRLIASSSPEGFLAVENDAVETRPIKGTRRRSADPDEDHALGAELLASEKDRAENIMIVDLMRNDLSRVCRPGSVEVPVLCGLESYASVHHLVSVVRGRLKPGLDALHLIAACFPGGSITGAPKIRAIQIIHELEPEPRGVYCGSVVHLGFDGSLRSSIAIRTLVAEDGVASVRAGGGITLLSDPEEEYEESLTKAERLLAAFDSPAESP
jgi:para-aminobenzoate synthetase component 1